MKKSAGTYRIWELLITVGLLAILAGCQKEYSYEGSNSRLLPGDSISSAPPVIREFPACPYCDSNKVRAVGSWDFVTGNSYLCGTTTNSGFVGGTTFFTFFGPSACSADTGLVVSIYLPVKMDHDINDLITNTVAFYYYDHNAPKDIFISDPSLPFTANITSYVFATGICTGTFNGTVFRASGDTAHISNGHFVIKL